MSCPEEKIWELSKRERFLWQPKIPRLGKPQKPLSLQSYNPEARTIHTVSSSEKDARNLLEFLKIVPSKCWDDNDLPLESSLIRSISLMRFSGQKTAFSQQGAAEN